MRVDCVLWGGPSCEGHKQEVAMRFSPALKMGFWEWKTSGRREQIRTNNVGATTWNQFMISSSMLPLAFQSRISFDPLWKVEIMPRPPSPSIPEKEFLYASLKQSLRLDGRQPLEMRTPTLTFGTELGWVECALGKTRFSQPSVCYPSDLLTITVESLPK